MSKTVESSAPFATTATISGPAPVGDYTGSHMNQQTASYEPPRGQWRDGICDCFKNLWPSCCCVFMNSAGILAMWYAGQISTRVGFIKTIPLISVYITLIIICFIISIAGSVQNQDWGAVYIIPGVFALVFTIALRFRFASFFGIQDNCCAVFCTAFWCVPCSLCQMGRHLYGYTKQFDGDGDINGGMVYGNQAMNV